MYKFINVVTGTSKQTPYPFNTKLKFITFLKYNYCCRPDTHSLPARTSLISSFLILRHRFVASLCRALYYFFVKGNHGLLVSSRNNAIRYGPINFRTGGNPTNTRPSNHHLIDDVMGVYFVSIATDFN